MKSNISGSIVIFDSGVGGLTIFDAVRHHMPHWPLVYCFDNQAFPYGDKNKQKVLERVRFCIERLNKKINIALIIVACNTASTAVLPALRSLFNIPIVGVVPAIKPAAQASRNQCIGLLATPGTVGRSYTDKLINDYAHHCQVIRMGSNHLVQLAENKLHGITISKQTIKAIVVPFLEGPIVPDHIVLGCTHFPLLFNELSECLQSYNIKLVDSAEAIARRAKILLCEAKPAGPVKQAHKTFCTKQISVSHIFKQTLSRRSLNQPQLLN